MKFLRILLILSLSSIIIKCGKVIDLNKDNVNQNVLTQNTMIVNPIKESSQEELENLFGFKFNNLSEFKDLSFTIINTEELVGQVRFIFKDNEFCLRCQKTEKIEPIDISGLYYEWDNVINDSIGDFDIKVHIKDNIGFISWNDLKSQIAFNLSMTRGASEEILINMVRDYFIFDKNYFFRYIMESDSKELFIPSLSLDKKDKTFIFSFDPFSSYLSYGHYEEDKEFIYCLTDDKKYNYVFDIIDDEILSFNAEDSSPLDFINFSTQNDFVKNRTFFKLEQ